MTTLDVLLGAHTESEDFEGYLVQLDPLQISQGVRQGDVGESLGKAVDSWIELCELFTKVRDKVLPKILVLVEKWSSLSGRAFNQVLKDYTTWLIDFTEKIYHMERRIFDY